MLGPRVDASVTLGQDDDAGYSTLVSELMKVGVEYRSAGGLARGSKDSLKKRLVSQYVSVASPELGYRMTAESGD